MGPRRYTVVAAAIFVVYALVLTIRPGGARSMQVYGDLSLTLTPALATAAAVLSAWRRTGILRRGWLLIGAGCASWLTGQAIWCWYELVAHRDMPYPSWADAGYLGILPPTVAGCALLAGLRSGRWRSVLDAMIISGSLLAVSWAFVLGPVVDAGAGSVLEWVIGLAYPIGDVAMMTMALLVLGNVSGSGRRSVLLLASGAFSLSVAHALYAYLVIRNAYVAGTWVDSGWFGGFLLLGLGALAAPRHDTVRESGAAADWFLLPYLPLAAAVLTCAGVTIEKGQPGTFLYCLTLVLVVLVVIRQIVSARDNRRLTTRLGLALDELRQREAELEYQAFHDPLTGLSNRALLEDRIEHAIAHQDRTGEPLALMYVDLDGFKKVNDEYGHHAGDQLLTAVADRLSACARDSDTVARLGGDEFAVLCERMASPGDEEVIAARIVERLAEPFELAAGTARIGASVGLARRAPEGLGMVQLMRDADAAMYRAKAAGKGRLIVA